MTAAQAAGFEHRLVIDVYARRSFDKDGTTIHEDEQAEECIERIEETPGWILGKVFKDHALSAWKPRVKRAAFEEMMLRLETGVSNGILVWDLSRFSRKPMEGERLLALAEEQVVVASLSTTYNLRSAEGRKQFRNKMTDNAGESDTISERSRRGMRLKAKRGKSLATQRGFGRDGYLPRPKREDGQPDADAMRERVPAEQLEREREAVRDAAKRLIAGEPLSAIAAEWNAAGLLTLRGSQWDVGGLRQMLEAPAIAGLVEHRPTVKSGVQPPRADRSRYVVGNNGDGPLDEETWRTLMATFGARRRGRPASVYLLSGLVFCAECGGKLYGRPREVGGSVGRREYWCQTRGDGKGCAKVKIEQDFADRTVKAMVLKRLGDPRHVDRVARVAARVQEESSRLRAERERINGEMTALASKTGTPGWNLERVDAALANYQPQLDKVEEELAQLEALPDSGLNSAIEDVESDWELNSEAHRRLLIQRAFPEGLEVTRAATSRPETLKASRIRKRIRAV